MRKVYTTLVLIAISVSAIAQLKVVENGDIGIGTTTPNEKLEINGCIGRTAHNNGALVGGYDNIGVSSTYTNPIYTIGSNYKPGTATLENMYGIGYSHTNASFIPTPTATGWGLYIAADGDARVWLGGQGDSYINSGNLGIGTTSPTKKLDVNGDINYTGNLYKDGELIELSGGSSSNWTESGTNIYYTDGNVGINSTNPGQKLYVNGSISTRYGEYLYLNSSTDNNWIFGKDLSKNIIVTGVGISTENRRFYVYDEAGNKEIINADFYSGKVGIGCSPTEKLDVNGNVRANQFLVSSDKRLKKNIKNIGKGLDKLVKVRGVEYNLLAENEQPNRFKYNSNIHKEDVISDTTGVYHTEMNVIAPDKKHIGFIAQEVQELYPELVSVDDDGFLSIDYIGFIPLLVEAIKEQQTKVNKNGISVGEMNGKLLQKIEELTLNTVQQKDVVDNQQSLINNQQELIKDLLKRVEKLENK